MKRLMALLALVPLLAGAQAYRYEVSAERGGSTKISYLDGWDNIFINPQEFGERLPEMHPELVRVPGTSVYHNPLAAASATCKDGTTTAVFVRETVTVKDGCALANAVKAKTFAPTEKP